MQAPDHTHDSDPLLHKLQELFGAENVISEEGTQSSTRHDNTGELCYCISEDALKQFFSSDVRADAGVLCKALNSLCTDNSVLTQDIFYPAEKGQFNFQVPETFAVEQLFGQHSMEFDANLGDGPEISLFAYQPFIQESADSILKLTRDTITEAVHAAVEERKQQIAQLNDPENTQVREKLEIMHQITGQQWQVATHDYQDRLLLTPGLITVEKTGTRTADLQNVLKKAGLKPHPVLTEDHPNRVSVDLDSKIAIDPERRPRIKAMFTRAVKDTQCRQL